MALFVYAPSLITASAWCLGIALSYGEAWYFQIVLIKLHSSKVPFRDFEFGVWPSCYKYVPVLVHWLKRTFNRLELLFLLDFAISRNMRTVS